jgi:predicted transcriptional regulator of viral defense system
MLGDRGSSLLSDLLIQGKRVFTIDDAAEIYGSKSSGLRDLLSLLVRRRWLQRVEPGKYLVLPLEAGREGEWAEHEFIIGSLLVKPYYIGFRSALNYYGYTEQVSRTVFVASTRRKLKPALEVSGVTYRFVYVSQGKLFGIDEELVDGHPVRISEREKTIVDCLDRSEYCGGTMEVAKALYYGHDELDFARMANYAKMNGNRAASQRLGYLIETLGIATAEAVDTLRETMSNSYARLDTLAGAGGRYVERWKVLVNVPYDELLQWQVQ